VLAAGRGEDLSEQQTEAFGIEPGLGIVRPCQLATSLDSGPLPAVAKRCGHLGPGAQTGELRRAVGDEGQRGLSADRMGDDAGVDKRRLDSPVASQGGNDHQPTLAAGQGGRFFQSRH